MGQQTAEIILKVNDGEYLVRRR